MDDAPTPLDVLLRTMSLKWNEGALDDAVALAKAAAPYLHARAVAARSGGDISVMSDKELDDLFGTSAEGTAPAGGDSD